MHDITSKPRERRSRPEHQHVVIAISNNLPICLATGLDTGRTMAKILDTVAHLFYLIYM